VGASREQFLVSFERMMEKQGNIQFTTLHCDTSLTNNMGQQHTCYYILVQAGYGNLQPTAMLGSEYLASTALMY
jgi:hypothetical protein